MITQRVLFKCSLLVVIILSLSAKSFSQCNPYPQVNAVINGDFESGYIASGPGSFATDQLYVYAPANAANAALMDAVMANPNANGPCAWNSDGKYHIAGYYGTFRCDGGNWDGHPFLTEANGRYDHTKGIGGDGKYLMVDTKTGGGSTAYGVKIWEQDVDVFANTFYYFSAWFINFTPNSTGGARAQLRFVVQALDGSNNPIGAPTELGASAWSPAEASRGNSWEQYYNTWTSPIGTVKARLGIYNQSPIAIGNDVGIDDISFINGCQAIQSLTIPPAPSLPATFNLCSTNGSVVLDPGVPTNAGAGRTFTWYSGTSYPQTELVLNSTTQNTYTVSTPGTYRVCVYQPGGCSKSATIVVTNTNTVSVTPATASLCNPNSSTQLLTSSLGSASAFYTYQWQRNGTNIGGATATTYNANQTGTYTVNATHSSIPACNVSNTATLNNTNTMTTSIGANQNLCNSSTATFTSSLTGSAFTYEWLRNGTVISGATTASYTATQTGTYTVRLLHPISGCNVQASASVTSTNSITPNHNTFCSGSPANLSVSPNATCPYRWYSAASGGSLLASGCTYSPSPAGTTTYYVEDTTNVSYNNIGRNVTSANIGSELPGVDWNADNINRGLTFNTTKQVLIQSVDVWIEQYSSVTNMVVSIRNSSGVVIGSSAPITHDNSAWPVGANPARVTVPLNIKVPIGTNYTIVVSGGTIGGLRRNDTFGGPYNSPGGGLSITGGTPNGRYNYFANWSIKEYSNPCARMPVTATLETPCTTPVDFASFVVFKEGNTNVLKWATTSEINSDVFVIERSFDGINFHNIGTVQAAGHSKQLLNYSFTDLSPLDGLSYYRIREVDFDGSVTYSSIQVVNRDKNNSLIIYPNPSSGVFSVSSFAGISDESEITVTDMTGRVILQRILEGTVEAVDLTEAPAGVYYLQVKSGSEIFNGKVIKQ
ncbi:MAG: T9SS type A sorting domain-containing protein [Cytophagaceae bacterium]